MRRPIFGSGSNIIRPYPLIPGSVRSENDQALERISRDILEPESVDSFFQWGYFNTIFHPNKNIWRT